MAKQAIKNSNQAVPDIVHHVSASQLDLDLSQIKKQTHVGFATYVRSLLQNWRQGTVAVKGRADVSFSNKKPWKQKGTGRARAGSPRSPLWRKGGVTFGPQPRVRTLTLNKQVKQQVMLELLASYINSQRVIQLDWNLNSEVPKTALAFKALRDAGLANRAVNIFLPVDDAMSFASFANIPNVRILFFDQPNAFDLAQGDQWVFLKKDFDHFKNMVSRWI